MLHLTSAFHTPTQLKPSVLLDLNTSLLKLALLMGPSNTYRDLPHLHTHSSPSQDNNKQIITHLHILTVSNEKQASASRPTYLFIRFADLMDLKI